ncbi:MAG: Ycf66 family protein [Microcystaceae cyanobacterium]
MVTDNQRRTDFMLAYFLAIALTLASLYLYLSAFFARDIHRQDDFLWSGVGLFYALILWICAGQIKGSVLLGQGAAVALVLSFGWQTIRLRRAIANPDQALDQKEFSVISWFKGRFSGKKAPVVAPNAEESPETPSSPAKPTENKEDSTLMVVSTPTGEEIFVEEEAIAMTDTTSEEITEVQEDSTPMVVSTPTGEEIFVEEEAIAMTDTTTEEITEVQEDSTPIVVSTPTGEEILVEEEAIAMTDTTTKEISEEDPLDDILEDLEGKIDETETSESLEDTIDNNLLDFEPYISDNEAETVIEAYTPPTITPNVTETKKSSETVAEDKDNL